MADLKEKTYVEDVDRSVYDIRDAENDAYRMESGLTPEIVEKLSKEKDDPVWKMCIRDSFRSWRGGRSPPARPCSAFATSPLQIFPFSLGKGHRHTPFPAAAATP